MKNSFTLILLFTTSFLLHSQIANIPSGPFKSRLVNSSILNQRVKDLAGNWIAIDANADGEIQVSEAANASYINLNSVGVGVFNIVGINEFPNLVYFYMQDANLYDINLHGLQHLEIFNVTYSSLQYIYLSDLPALKRLLVWYNHLATLDVHELTSLELLDCHNNYITSLDASNLIHLTSLQCGGNRMTYINIKNGSVESLNDGIGQSDSSGNPCLKFICADENQIDNVQLYINNMWPPNQPVVVNTYCSFVPGGIYYTVSGTNRLDINSNGCDSNDLIIPYLKLQVNDGTTTDYIYSNLNGFYSVPVLAGAYTLTPVLENLPGYSISPASINVNFPTTASPDIENLCITPITAVNDLEITIVPTSIAIPGFDSYYEIVYRNKGTESLSGTVNLSFDDSKMDFNNSVPSPNNIMPNNLSWNFTNLNPFETRAIGVEFSINTSTNIPPVISGDILTYNATIETTATDATPNDNTFTLNDPVFNSHDPNDKKCLEGTLVTPNVVGDYVHYVIRFENTGTTNAHNIVVKDIIDTSKFDISTLVPLSGSDSFITHISHNNRVEFIFENINLPFDDANNDGYIAFKIKTKPSLVVGDTFSNSANIYFDYNFPVVTNNAVSTIQLLNTDDFESNKFFTLSPIPAADVLHITSKENKIISSVSVYNTLGQLIQVSTNPTENIDVSNLQTGNYIVKITFDEGKTAVAKFIKK